MYFLITFVEHVTTTSWTICIKWKQINVESFCWKSSYQNGRIRLENYDLEWSGSCSFIGCFCLLLQVNISSIKTGIQCRKINKLTNWSKRVNSSKQVKCSDGDKIGLSCYESFWFIRHAGLHRIKKFLQYILFFLQSIVWIYLQY